MIQITPKNGGCSDIREIRREERERWNKGDPFDFPETIDDLELYIGYFFDRIRAIVAIENHTKKFDSIKQIIDIIHDSADMENVHVRVFYLDGVWGISDIGCEQDVLNLPKVARRFSKIYRFHANDYSNGENQNVKILNDSLDTIENIKERKMI